MKDGYGCKKPSVKGMANTGYLGHFAQDKHIQAGHNTSAKPKLKGNVEDRLEAKAQLKELGESMSAKNVDQVMDLKKLAQEALEYSKKKK